MTIGPTASCIQNNSQAKVNQTLLYHIFIFLTYCDEQAINGAKTAGEGPTDSQIQQNFKLKVDKTQEILF